MKRLLDKNINTATYWDKNQTAFDFGLRQIKYRELAGEGGSIIDLGCGLSPFLSKVNFKRRIGLDFSPETVRLAQRMYPHGLGYIVGDITNTLFEDKSFDVSVAGEVIEHLEDPEALIKEMKRITNKRIVVSTPILEFKDPEHIWQLTGADFIYWGFRVEVIKSQRFPGRSYIFAVCDLT